MDEANAIIDRDAINNDDDDDDDDDEDDDDDDNDDDDEDGINQLADGLSDFDNFSGRDTPIISGRDTSSSHSHDDVHNMSSSAVGGRSGKQTTGGPSGSGGVGGGASNSLATNSSNNNQLVAAGDDIYLSSLPNGASSSSSSNVGNNNNNGNRNSNMNNASSTIMLSSGNNTAIDGVILAGAGGLNPSRGPQLPITVAKPNGDDINEKFCKFEINKGMIISYEPGKHDFANEIYWKILNSERTERGAAERDWLESGRRSAGVGEQRADQHPAGN